MKVRNLFHLGTAVMILAATSALNAQVNTDGLAGRWKFDEGSGITAQDSTDGGHHGTLAGAAYFVTDDAHRGNVLNVNGTSGEVSYEFSEDLQPMEGTISIWVKPTMAVTADLVRQKTDALLRVNRLGNFYAYCLRVTATGQAVAIIANDDPKTSVKQPQIVLTAPANSVPLNQWTHVAMTWGGGNLTLYVNGRRSGSTKFSPNPSSGLSYHGNSPMTVAAAFYESDTGHLEYFGMLSDLRMYSRGLGAREVTGIAKSGQ